MLDRGARFLQCSSDAMIDRDRNGIDDRDDLVNQRTLNFRSRFNWSASWQLWPS